MNHPEDGAEASELAQSSVAQSATGADSIGRIETSKGNVFITRTDGSKINGESGLEIFQGDTVDTDASGSVGIVFADDSVFSLAEKGSMVIDTMIYDPGTQEGKSALSITEGVFTFLSGSIAKTGVDAMVINTPTATIGIRGTSLGGKVTDGKGSTITLLPDGGIDKAAGNEGALKGQQGSDGLGAGEVTISNSVGTQTISQPYQTTQVSSQYSSPTLPVTLPASVVNQAYASAISAAPAPRGASAVPGGSNSGGNTGGGGQTAATGTEAAANPADGADDGTPVGDGTPVDAAAAAEGAAAVAFNDAIAGGASLDDAMAAATSAAVATTVQAVLAANPEAFGTAASISSIVGAVVNAAMGGLGSSAGDPLDAGKGSDNAVSSQAAQAMTEGGALAAIAGQAQAAAQAAVVTNAVALVQSGLMSQGALSELTANLNAGQPLGSALGGGLGGGLGGAINAASFGAVFANVLATVVTTVANTIDDVIASIKPASETTVTTDVAGTESHDLVANQNDVFVGGAGNDTLTLSNAAQAGDTFDGSGGTDTLTLATTGISHVFRVTNTETVNLPSVGAGNSALLNIVGAGSTSISGSATGTTAIAGDSSDQILTFTNTFDGSTNSLSLTGGGGTDKVTFANGTNVIDAMVGIESVELGSSSTTFNSSLSGVVFLSSTGTGDVTLDGVGNSISIDAVETLDTVTGSSGTDTLTFNGAGTINSLADFETVTAASSSANFTLAAGGQSTTVSGTFGTITGGSGSDTITFDSGGATIGILNSVEAVVGSSTGSNFTFGTAGGGTTISGIFGTITGEASEGSNTITFASAGATITNVSGNIMTYIGGSGTNILGFANATNESTLSGTFATVTGGTGSDRIVFASTGVTLGNVSAVETIVGNTGTDTISLAAGGQTTIISSVETVIGGSGADTITLAAGGQTTIISDVETITGGSGTDSVTLALNGGTVDAISGIETLIGSSGVDIVTLAGGGNTLTVTNVETLIGGSGVDSVTITGSSVGTLTPGGGADSITFSGTTSAQTVVYSTTSDYGDTVTGFTAGSGGDVIKINVAMSRGTNADFEALATGGTVGANTAFVNYTTDIATPTTAGDVATALNSLTGLSTGNQMLFAVGGSGTGTRVWHWVDGSGSGTSDGTVEAAELTKVVDLASVSHTTLTTANFSGYTGVDPLVFDLDGDGVELLGADAGVLFDVNGDGLGDSVGWVGADDGLLVADLNGDGLITEMFEVVSPEFGPSAAAGISANSLDALALLDGNTDGVIDAADDIFGTLQLWRDANTDGITDSGELMSLGDLGIESISLAGSGVTIDNAGNSITRSSSFTYSDGSTGEVAEVTLAQGGNRFIFESTNTSLNLSDFSGQTSFLGTAGDDDKLVLDTSSLGISSIAYEEITWDGTTGAISLNNTAASVVVLTGAAGTQVAAAAALAAGNASGSNAVYLLRDSANGDKLTMVHTDDLANDGAKSAIGVFGSQTTDVAANLDATDFAIVA